MDTTLLRAESMIPPAPPSTATATIATQNALPLAIPTVPTTPQKDAATTAGRAPNRCTTSPLTDDITKNPHVLASRRTESALTGCR